MDIKKNSLERRKDKRFKLKRSALAIMNSSTISDVEIIDKTLIGSKEMRRCGIQFEGLSNNQIS